MSKVFIQSKDYQKLADTYYFSAAEIYFLKSFHPVAIFLNTVGFTWFLYYMWHHDWPLAVGVIALSKLLSVLAVMDVSPQKMADTFLGKISQLHLHPANLFIQVLGLILFVVGVWMHTTEMMLGGFSLLLLGHLFGWSKVDTRFASHVEKKYFD